MAPLCTICIGVLYYQHNLFQPYHSGDETQDNTMVDGGRAGHALSDARSVDNDGCSFSDPEDSSCEDAQESTREGRCRDIDKGCEAEGILCGHHSSYESLAQSAAKSCPICRPFWDQLSRSQQELLRSATHAVHSRSYPGTPSTTQDWEDYPMDFLTVIKIHRGESAREDFRLNIKFNEFASATRRLRRIQGVHVLEEETFEASPPSSLSQMTPTSSNTSSAESLRLADWWLRHCIPSHIACNREAHGNEWYPTRLLCLEDDIVRLIITSEEKPTGPYMTLSHRWGQGTLIRLLESNLNEFRQSIATTSMPKTFQDAIYVSKALGVQYLWIDSLCILQDRDNLKDWYHEATLMHKVYSRAYCNISACTGEGADGLFRARDAQDLVPTSTKLNLRYLGRSDAYATCTLTDLFLWKHDVVECAVNKRGWVFQERILSPRVLYFGRNQLFWECREHRACESYPLGLPLVYDSLNSTDLKRSLDLGQYTVVSPHMPTHQVDERYHLWTLAIWTYSKTDLTNPVDKLIALSGIVKPFVYLLDDEYLVGMWRKRLEHQLVWVTVASVVSTSSTFAPIYRAPSWSWAAIDRPVDLSEERHHQEVMISVKDVHINYASYDTTGRVTGGWLDLQGHLKPMKLIWDTPTDSSDLNPWTLSLDGNVSQPKVSVLLDVLRRDSSAFEPDNMARRLYYVPAAISSSESRRLAIIILRCLDKVMGLFERLGIGESEEAIDKDLLLADMTAQVRLELPSVRFENGLHIIRII